MYDIFYLKTNYRSKRNRKLSLTCYIVIYYRITLLLLIRCFNIYNIHMSFRSLNSIKPKSSWGEFPPDVL